MNITLKNNLIEEALGLRSEVFHLYISIVYLLRQGCHASKSITYNVSNKILYKALKDHLGYDKSQRAFDKNIKKLKELKLIEVGVHKTKFIDILHKSEKFDPEKKNYWTDIEEDKLKHLIFESDGNELKFSLKNLILSEKVLKSLNTKSSRYLSKVYKVSDKKTLKRITQELFIPKEEKPAIGNVGSLVGNKEELSCATPKKLIAPIDTLLSNNIKTSVEKKKPTPSVDFKNLDLDLKSINTINKIRRSSNKENLTTAEIQESINQFSYAVDQELIHVNDPTRFLAHHLKTFGIYVLKDEYISGYQYFKSTGELQAKMNDEVFYEVQQEALNLVNKEAQANHSRKPEILTFEGSYRKFLSLGLSNSEVQKMHRELVSKVSIFEGFDKQSLDLKIGSNYYGYLLGVVF